MRVFSPFGIPIRKLRKPWEWQVYETFPRDGSRTIRLLRKMRSGIFAQTTARLYPDDIYNARCTPDEYVWGLCHDMLAVVIDDARGLIRIRRENRRRMRLALQKPGSDSCPVEVAGGYN